MRKQFLFILFGIGRLLRDDDFRGSLIETIIVLLFAIPTTIFFYTDWPFSFYNGVDYAVIRFIGAFFLASLVWGIVAIAITFTFKAIGEVIKKGRHLRQLGVEHYYKVFDILKDENK